MFPSQKIQDMLEKELEDLPFDSFMDEMLEITRSEKAQQGMVTSFYSHVKTKHPDVKFKQLIRLIASLFQDALDEGYISVCTEPLIYNEEEKSYVYQDYLELEHYVYDDAAFFCFSKQKMIDMVKIDGFRFEVKEDFIVEELKAEDGKNDNP